MRPRGEDVASAVRAWLIDEIKGASSRRYDLGKFFLGLSTGTLSLFATLLKFASEHRELNSGTITCFIVLLFSALIGLLMALPTVVRVRSDMNLYTDYDDTVRSTLRLTIIWSCSWLAGFFFGVFELFD